MNKIILTINFILAISSCHFANAQNTNAEKSYPTANQKIFWTGCYKQKSYLCTFPQDGSNCEDKFSDILKITYKGPTYIVQLNSTQANQNICAFKLEMSESDGKLIHETELGQISLTLQGESIEISSKGVDPTALGLGICGIHADINELEYKIASKSTNESDCANTERGSSKNHFQQSEHHKKKLQSG